MRKSPSSVLQVAAIFLHSQFFMKLTDRILAVKDKHPCEYDQAYPCTDHRWIQKTDLMQPYQNQWNKTCNGCLNQIKQIFFFFKLQNLYNNWYGTLNCQCAKG